MTIATKIVPLFGASTASGKSQVVTNQRRVNVYFERRPDKDKTAIACYGTPGLVLQWSLATTGNAPLRGLIYQTQTSTLFGVAGNTAYNISTINGALTTLGTLSTSSGTLSMACNGSQLLITDTLQGKLWNGSAFSNLPASFPNGNTVTYVSDFFVADGGRNIWFSNANDGSTWNSLAFAAVSQYTDGAVAVDNLQGNLVVFCSRHTEFWQNVGTSPVPFAPIISATNQYGLASVFSRAHVGDSLIFMAATPEGGYQFVQLTGFSAKVISDADIDEILGGLINPQGGIALAYQIGQHKFYQCSFISDNRTLLYDVSTGLWSEVQTGTSTTHVRHQAQLSVNAGAMYFSDWQNGNLYTMSETAYTDNGTAILRQLVTRHILSNFNRIRISCLYLDMETAVGNGTVNLEYSKDNGRTYGSVRTSTLGASGANLQRVIWRRFGSTRDATFRISMTDADKFVIANAALKVRAAT